MFLACMWLAVAFHMKAGALLQIGGFAIFMAGFSLGFGPVTLLYIAEVFPTAWRGKGMALALFLSRFVGASSTLLFPVAIQVIGVSTSFLAMSGFNLLVLAAV